MEKKRADIIANSLEEMILEGRFSNGERLDEAQLAVQFSVSRTPIREAFHKLTQSGLTEQIPRRGVFVRQPGPIELLEMFEVMAEMEAVCARLAAQRMTDAALSQLQSANERCNAALNAQNPDLYYTENENFHAIIYQQSGNDFLKNECMRLHRRLKPYRRLQLRLRGRLKQSMTEHEAILNALEAGDSQLAANAIRDHVTIQGEKFNHLIASLKQSAAS